MTVPDNMNVLISLFKGYGLGDAVQVSAVLCHVAKARPNWLIDYKAEEGRHCVGRGIVANTFAYGSPYPSNYYDAEVQIVLYDTWANWHDRPNTRVSSCLHEMFGLEWNAGYGQYQVAVSDESMKAASALLFGLQDDRKPSRHTRKVVAVHYEGDSSPTKKNLSHTQADEVCEAVDHMGYTPVILDWRNKSQLHWRRFTTPSQWGRDAEMVCAVISQCSAFVGIDSGPSKCASATDTPSMVVWTGHHPAQFHDPAPNTTHLVPHGYHGLEPVCNDEGVIRFFEKNYNVRMYKRDPVCEIKKWLAETLR